MDKEYREILGIPKEHSIKQTKTEWKQKGSQDIDIYWFDEVDRDGKIVAKYILKDSTSTYPPFNRNITFEKEKI